MDLDRFRKMVSDPARSRKELEQIFRNALEKKQLEFAREAKDVLDKRFPGWDNVASRRRGATETIAKFRGTERRCPTAKEAYIWLIERFISS
jgi:hypothetical protein